MEVNMDTHNLLLLGQVAKLLKIPPHRITYLFVAGKIQDVPTMGNRRVFSLADVRRVADALGVKLDETQLEKEVTHE
jgi:hypothetical protein